MAIYSLNPLPGFGRPLHGFAVTDRDSAKKDYFSADWLYSKAKKLGWFMIRAEVLARILQ
jgi:hypothetical protein